MRQILPKRFVTVIVIFAAMLACSTSGNATELPENEQTGDSESSPDSSLTDVPIQHQIFPGNLPESQSGQAGDQDSSVTADQKKSNGGDRFTFELFERPFNANTMDVYYPNLDIIESRVYQDETWIYGTVKVVDRSSAPEGSYRLAMQLDVQVDGKGDWLVLVLNPTSADWTTDGVQVYFDANGDVGNLTPVTADEGTPGGDGFEKLVFDQGSGDDPDIAWVRVSPQDSNTVEIAVKRSLLGIPLAYMVNMWTGHTSLDPAIFDYDDHYSHEQAGAADPGYPLFYPIKEISELDNSCRIAVGFQPKGTEPGLCSLALAPDDPGSVSDGPGAPVAPGQTGSQPNQPAGQPNCFASLDSDGMICSSP